MTSAISLVDLLILLFGLCVLIGIGVYFWRETSGAHDFFSSQGSLSAFPIGISASRTILASLPAYGLLNEAYFAGTKLLILPLLLWCCWPLLTRVILPLYMRLNVTSIYEYLELRYDRRVRRAAALVSVLWRFAWLIALLSGAGLVLSRLFSESSRVWWLVLLLGATYTLYSLMGGLRAVLWAGMLQALLALTAIALVIVSIWQQLDGGLHRVADVAGATGRTALLDLTWNPLEPWSLFTLVPHFLLMIVTLHMADQATLQHYLAARNLAEARRASAWGWLYVTAFIGLSAYAGMAMLAYYHDHPQSLRVAWVANLDPRTGQGMTDGQGDPLIPWSPVAVTPQNVDRLVAERRLLRPNTNQPFDSADDLVREVAGREQIDIQQLAKRTPPARNLSQGEILLHERARGELFPHWIASQPTQFFRGVWLAAIVVVSLLSFDATLVATCQVVRLDLRGTGGIGRAKPTPVGVEPVSHPNRPPAGLLFSLGSVATLLAVFALLCGEGVTAWLLRLVAGLGGPLAAICLLGMFSRRTTAAAAWIALWTGVCVGSGLSLVSLVMASTRLGEMDLPLQANWLPLCGFVLALAVGTLGSLLGNVGPRGRKSREQLRGLVAGCGKWGIRQPEAPIVIPDSFPLAAPPAEDPRTAP